MGAATSGKTALDKAVDGSAMIQPYLIDVASHIFRISQLSFLWCIYPFSVMSYVHTCQF